MKDSRIKTASVLLAILVAFSRVALNYHTYFDIAGGALLGIAITYAVNLFYHKSSRIKAFKTINLFDGRQL